MARWLLVRHGETDWNRNERAQGHTDVPLNEVGRQQTIALAKVLTEVRLDLAVSSDLSRATETAHLLVGHRSLKAVATAELREFSYGKWEGLTLAEAEKADPALYARLLRQDPSFVAPGGESAADVGARVRRFVERTRSQHQDRNLLVVAHGGSLRMLLVTLLGLPLESSPRFILDPASLSVVEVHTSGSWLIRWNDTSHYRGAP
ncbi:MAG: histidine phosphatase family protein [Dehalococcoidia bacterium]|nr:histidine phosphatase family protein [Dehalococcoidia bacterium]